jgi:hypothetical protein
MIRAEAGPAVTENSEGASKILESITPFFIVRDL